MVAGAEFALSVNVLHGAYKTSASDPGKRKNDIKDSNDGATLETGRDVEAAGRSPLVSAPTFRRCLNSAHLSSGHQSDLAKIDMKGLDIGSPRASMKLEFIPIIRSGGWADIGCRRSMEDAYVMVDDLVGCSGFFSMGVGPGAYYGVFDGHSGKDAAEYVRENLLRYILEEVAFPTAMEEAIEKAFLRIDQALAEGCLIDEGLCSGTTALAVLIMGRTLLVANAGDCRAVLCKRGNAVEMSRDHKACCLMERKRIEASGGFVDKYGYLNGELTVARALGDWHIEGLKDGVDGPLSAIPEMQQVTLTEEDEFLIIGCDGLWDVFSSQNAVDFARRQLQKHNDPQRCSQELVDEALRRDPCDNLTVVMVCFQEDPPPNRAVFQSVRRSIAAEGLQSLTSALQHVIEGCAYEGISLC